MDETFTCQPLSPVRKVIAARMAEATRTIPHFRLTAEIEVDALIEFRSRLRTTRPGIPLSLNDLLIRGCALALMDFPEINIQWYEQGIRRFHSADVSVVIATKAGLSTPIIRSAEKKSVWEISEELRHLSACATANSLKMDQVFGGSFTISNLGMHGVDQFDAIINPPQCAILAVGAAKSRMVVSEHRQTRVAKVLRATLSIDHRALDGVAGATFLSALRARLEQPACLYAD
jgi:pyruvate dehydrogenase E2 component (dihydrolipoamide acetyltransferase)